MEPRLKFVRALSGQTVWNTETCLMAYISGQPEQASTREIKPIWILMEQQS